MKYVWRQWGTGTDRDNAVRLARRLKMEGKKVRIVTDSSGRYHRVEVRYTEYG